MDRFTRLISIMVLGDDARESTKHLVDRLRLTGEATRELSSSLDPARVVQAIVERIAELVDVDRITVTKFRADSVEAIAGYDRNRVPARIGATWDLTPELRARHRQRRGELRRTSPMFQECRPICRNSCRMCARG